MWVKCSAIRPVPSYARIPTHALDALRLELADDDEEFTRSQLDDAFERLEKTQPVLAAYITETLSKPLDEMAIGLGYFLIISIWLGFEQMHGTELHRIEIDELQATRELLLLDEQLRQTDPSDVLETDDVIAMEQPELLEFVHDHVDRTLDSHADEIDLDDVQEVYRVILTEILALSYAVERPLGFPVARTELLA
jgi:DNA-binding protein Fis